MLKKPYKRKLPIVENRRRSRENWKICQQSRQKYELNISSEGLELGTPGYYRTRGDSVCSPLHSLSITEPNNKPKPVDIISKLDASPKQGSGLDESEDVKGLPVLSILDEEDRKSMLLDLVIKEENEDPCLPVLDSLP
uniref:Uncharacterized protein n=1 Tax=Ciona intestinalis TaxID=7719 RepID=H2XYI3_CIOIN